jgi:hypothetical protein
MYTGEVPPPVLLALTTNLALVKSVFDHVLPHVSAAPPSMRVESVADKVVVLAGVIVVTLVPPSHDR